MDEQRKKAFDFAQEVAKQLITLATAIIAVTLTFSKDVATHGTGKTHQLVSFSWYFFLVSILFGLWTLMALTGNLETSAASKTPASIRTKNVVFPAVLQVLCFLVGMLLAILFGVLASRGEFTALGLVNSPSAAAGSRSPQNGLQRICSPGVVIKGNAGSCDQRFCLSHNELRYHSQIFVRIAVAKRLMWWASVFR